MRNINLYEQIPKNDFPLTLRIDEYRQFKFRLHWHEHGVLFLLSPKDGIGLPIGAGAPSGWHLQVFRS